MAARRTKLLHGNLWINDYSYFSVAKHCLTFIFDKICIDIFLLKLGVTFYLFIDRLFKISEDRIRNPGMMREIIAERLVGISLVFMLSTPM